MYGYFMLGMLQIELAQIYCKDKAQVSRWIQRYSNGDNLTRKEVSRIIKFQEEHLIWIVDYFTMNPTAYLVECRKDFIKKFNISISISTIFVVLRKKNFTRKVVERRAMQIKIADVHRFENEINSINWTKIQLVFLDEVSFDNREMVRKYGYCMKGERLIVRGEFRRKPRVSYLAFLGVSGLLDYYQTPGTFTRKEFIKCLVQFAKYCPKVSTYPGTCSIWIMDGAKIHTHPEIVNMVRSFGIIPIFLPAYCPFYNPIEFLFGIIKHQFQVEYREGQVSNLSLFVNRIFQRYINFNFSKIFDKCGYGIPMEFNPGCGYIPDE